MTAIPFEARIVACVSTKEHSENAVAQQLFEGLPWLGLATRPFSPGAYKRDDTVAPLIESRLNSSPRFQDKVCS